MSVGADSSRSVYSVGHLPSLQWRQYTFVVTSVVFTPEKPPLLTRSKARRRRSGVVCSTSRAAQTMALFFFTGPEMATTR